jgi:hypothetical protein
MSAITKFVGPTELFFQPAKRTFRFENPEAKRSRLISTIEPERRLWKLSAQAVSPKCALMESFIVLLLLLVALAAIGSCLIELSHLLQSDGIGRVVINAVSETRFSPSTF